MASSDSNNSNILQLDDGTRQGHFLTLFGFSDDSGGGDRIVAAVDLYNQVVAFLAYKHLNDRSSQVLADLPERMKGCPDLRFSFEVRDTQYSSRIGIQQLMEATTPPPISSAVWQEPFAITGCTYSSVASTVSTVTGNYDIPMISGSATSSALEDPTGGRLFARTIPTNAGDARAAMAYYQSIGVTHVANLYIKDSWGSHYNRDLKRQASRLGISLLSLPYEENEASIEAAVLQLKESGYRYHYSILYVWETVMPVLYRHGLIGRSNPQYNHITAELADLLWDGFRVDQESYLADALDGVGVLQLHNEDHVPFQQALYAFVDNPALQQEFLDAIAEPGLRLYFNNYTFPPPEFSFDKYMYYDAQIALGLAACETPGLFSGRELYANLAKLEFDGVSGPVRFDHSTGTRATDSVQYRVDNLILSDTTTDGRQEHSFDSYLSAVISGDSVTIHTPFVYADGTTTPPASLPSVVVEHNLIPLAAQMFGVIFASIVILASVGFMVWTVRFRTAFVVRASQPIFLGQLCIGCIVMASAVYPMSLQGTESTSGLDRACMSLPWLFGIGFVIAISALSCKTWRLNRLLNSGQMMRRIEVHPKDAIRSFVISITLSIILLSAWTVVAPFQYERILVQNYDEFGRSIESYGACQASNDYVYWFFIPFLLINLCTLAVATYQSYKARNLATEFSESYYLALSMLSLAETLCLGVPILFVVEDNPTAFYLVKSTLVCTCCISILVPVFVPKYLKRRESPTEGAGRSQRASSNAMTSSLNQNRTRSLRMSSESRPPISITDSAVLTTSMVDGSSTESGPPGLEYGKMRIVRHSITQV